MNSSATTVIDWRPDIVHEIAAETALPSLDTKAVDFKGLQQRIQHCIQLAATPLAAELDNCANTRDKADKGVLVVFDSLERMLLASVAETLKLLRDVRHKLGSASNSRIMASFPRDVFAFGSEANRAGSAAGIVAGSLCELAEAVIDVYPLSSLESWMPGWYSNRQSQPFMSLRDCDCRRGLLRLEHKRQSGKVRFEVAAFEIGEQLMPAFSPIKPSAYSSSGAHLDGPEPGAKSAARPMLPAESAPAVHSQHQPPQATELPKSSDPAANLSFNLNLTDKQRRDKAGVELPYLEARHSDASGGGVINYQLDDQDDWDEEDPDDDLEI
ncbi:hypothetical protein EV174_002048 [Coemansia sp. RSA 2320]|nr:hypothetical protein EV174_002048 [Coemansia sp. RSA 2320]